MSQSYQEFKTNVYEPFQFEVLKAIAPVLSKSEYIIGLREEYKEVLFQQIADNATSMFFSKHSDYLKMQQRDDEVKKRDMLDKAALETFKKMRGISAEDFEKFVLQKLDKIVKERNEEKVWKMDEFSTKLFNLMVQYFTPTSALSSEVSRKKGLFVTGNIGCGKTTIFRGFAENPLHSFRITSAQNLVNMYVESPDRMFDYLSGKEVFERDSFGFTDRNIVVDEVGREELSVVPKGISWKTEPVNVMEKVFFWLYDHPEIRIHMISNANETKLRQLYGEASFSRINEIFNFVPMNENAPDRRFM